jgi:hypothetical protein
MGIQEIVAYLGKADAGASKENVVGGKDKRASAPKSESDRFTVSGRARALYEADQNKRVDVARERFAEGYYSKKEVLDAIVDGLTRDVVAGQSQN